MIWFMDTLAMMVVFFGSMFYIRRSFIVASYGQYKRAGWYALPMLVWMIALWVWSLKYIF